MMNKIDDYTMVLRILYSVISAMTHDTKAYCPTVTSALEKTNKIPNAFVKSNVGDDQSVFTLDG